LTRHACVAGVPKRSTPQEACLCTVHVRLPARHLDDAKASPFAFEEEEASGSERGHKVLP